MADVGLERLQVLQKQLLLDRGGQSSQSRQPGTRCDVETQSCKATGSLSKQVTAREAVAAIPNNAVLTVRPALTCDIGMI